MTRLAACRPVAAQGPPRGGPFLCGCRGSGNDSLIGGTGNDELRGFLGFDTLDGGDGTDTGYYALEAGSVTVDLSRGIATGTGFNHVLLSIQTVIGGNSADLITGDEEINRLEGGGGDDFISGLAGTDSLYGDDGNDTLDGGAGNDRLDGGNGRDRVRFGLLPGGVAVDLAAGTSSGFLHGNDILVSIEDVIGTQSRDVLSGSDVANDLAGLFGDDILDGRGGNDSLDGGPGNDVISDGDGQDTVDAGDGNDTVFSGAGNDALQGGNGLDTADFTFFSDANLANLVIDLAAGTAVLQGAASGDAILGFETVIGGQGNDSITGSTGTNRLVGGDGRDSILGNGGFDTIEGGEDNDTATGGNADDDISGGNGNDSLTGGGGSDDLRGDEGNDTLAGGLGDDAFDGGSGNDLLIDGGPDTAAGGDDVYAGGDGLDTVAYTLGIYTNGLVIDLALVGPQNLGSAGNDSFIDIEGISGTALGDSVLGTDLDNNDLRGANGNDTLRGRDGDDSLSGANDNDSLDGGAGNDQIDGGFGNDTIFSGLGDDSVIGGSGDDDILDIGGNNVIQGGAGFDKLSLFAISSAVNLSLAQGFYEVVNTGEVSLISSIEWVLAGASNDTLRGGSGANRLFGNDGDDFLQGNAGADTLMGDAGNDTISGGTGNDSLDGGSGLFGLFDLLSCIDAIGGVTVDLSANSAQGGGLGRDTVTGFDAVLGSAFADTITGSTFNEELRGSAGNDSLTGGSGDDTLVGGQGSDTLNGGTGRDRFVYFGPDETGFGAGIDLIRGFETGATGDILDVSSVDAIAATGADDAFTLGIFVAAGVVIRSTQVVGLATNTLYSFYTDGDAVADMVITLSGNRTLTAGVDFLL